MRWAMSGMGKYGCRLAGGGMILLFFVLLLFRFGIPEKMMVEKERALAPIPSLPTEGESWMKITQQNRKIGYAHRNHIRTENGFHFSERIFMRINTMGIVQPLTVRTDADLKPDRTLSGFQFELGSNLFRFTARGALSGKKLTVRIGGPGEEKVSVIEISEAPYLGTGILESLGAADLRTGEERSYPVFDPASLGQRPVQVTLLGDETLRVMGESRQARKLSVDFMGMKQIAWVDPSGAVLREEGILGIALERVSREEALAGMEGAVSADLTEIAAVPVSTPIGDPAALRRLKIRISGIPAGSFDLDGGRQVYRDDVLTVQREPFAASTSPTGNDPGELSVFLRSSPFIQSDHPDIRRKLAEILRPEEPDVVKAQKIVRWVYTNVEKRPVLSVPNALETLANRIGDCNEHAVLLAAFSRAAGIPADVETGIVYMRGRFLYHAWNILYLSDRGGWVTADAVLGEMPADVTHIRFIRGGADRQLDLAGLIGRLKLEVLEMER